MTFAGLLIAVVPSLVAVPVEAPRPAAREQVGTVLGEPIYRDQIKVGKDVSLASELFRLIQPALERYREEYRDEIRPTEEEVEFAAAYFLKHDAEMWEERRREARKELAELDAVPAVGELSPEERAVSEAVRKKLAGEVENPARFFARWLLEKRKFERHLYDEFGGGRVLFQQAGVEAFDATRRWLESLETKGDFTLSDPKFREELYRYWTGTNHGAFLSSPGRNPDAIEEFVNPEWFPRKAAVED